MNLSKVNIFYLFYQKIMKELTNVKQMDSFFTHVHTNVNKSVAIAWVWSGYELSAWESAMLFPVVVIIQLYVLSQFENQQYAKITNYTQTPMFLVLSKVYPLTEHTYEYTSHARIYLHMHTDVCMYKNMHTLTTHTYTSIQIFI